jgi:hypothetical protein
VAVLVRGVVLEDRPCATSATNTANPAVSAALEPITQRRMWPTRRSAWSRRSRASDRSSGEGLGSEASFIAANRIIRR